MSKSQPIQEATDHEKEAIRASIDSWIVSLQPTGGENKLHLPLEDEPLCSRARTLNGNNQSGQREVEYRAKDVACYPPGFKDICKYCIREWRRDGAK